MTSDTVIVAAQEAFHADRQPPTPKTQRCIQAKSAHTFTHRAVSPFPLIVMVADLPHGERGCNCQPLTTSRARGANAKGFSRSCQLRRSLE